MEAAGLRKTLIYSTLAVVLGLALVLLPLFTVAELRSQYESQPQPPSLAQRFKYVESPPPDSARFSSDVEVLGACFAIALVAYVFFRGKRSRREDRLLRSVPF
jgi:hypothetical protein